jgi:hypothetical protein
VQITQSKVSAGTSSGDVRSAMIVALVFCSPGEDVDPLDAPPLPGLAAELARVGVLADLQHAPPDVPGPEVAGARVAAQKGPDVVPVHRDAAVEAERLADRREPAQAAEANPPDGWAYPSEVRAQGGVGAVGEQPPRCRLQAQHRMRRPPYRLLSAPINATVRPC